MCNCYVVRTRVDLLSLREAYQVTSWAEVSLSEPQKGCEKAILSENKRDDWKEVKVGTEWPCVCVCVYILIALLNVAFAAPGVCVCVCSAEN